MSVLSCNLQNFSTVELCSKNLRHLLFHVHRFNRHSCGYSIYCCLPSKCMKQKFHVPFKDNCKNYNRYAKCVSPRILQRENGKNQRCRREQCSENLRSSLQLRSAGLQETKRRMARKMEELKENVVTVPNALCLARIAATPFLGYLVVQEFYMTSLGMFIFAGCTDVIDGYIARTFPGQQSMIGSFLDPAADKLLVATLFLTLTANGLIPVPLTSLIILRDVCLMTAGFYIRYVSLPPPKTLTRYFDVSFATAKLSPTGISKINTLIQLSLVALSLAAPVFGYEGHFLLKFMWYATATSTILSAGSYVYCRNTYKLLTNVNFQKKLQKSQY